MCIVNAQALKLQALGKVQRVEHFFSVFSVSKLKQRERGNEGRCGSIEEEQEEPGRAHSSGVEGL